MSVCVSYITVHVCIEHRGVLTVGDTLILDLQVLVGARAGVREDVHPGHDHTLGPVVAPGRMDGWIDAWMDGWREGEREGGKEGGRERRGREGRMVINRQEKKGETKATAFV